MPVDNGYIEEALSGENEAEAQPLSPAEIAAAQVLLEDGAEFGRIQEALVAWMGKRYGIVFVRVHSGVWAAKQQGAALWPTNQASGERRTWVSFHEMLIDLLNRIARTPEDVEAEFLKS